MLTPDSENDNIILFSYRTQSSFDYKVSKEHNLKMKSELAYILFVIFQFTYSVTK